MIETTKKLILSKLGLHGVWDGDLEGEGLKAIFTKNEEIPEELNPAYVLIGKVSDNLTNQELQEVIDNFDYEQAKRNVKLQEVKNERNKRLEKCDWIIRRHKDQLDLGAATDLSNEKFLEWLQYRQDLRDFPEVVDLNNVVFPNEPD